MLTSAAVGVARKTRKGRTATVQPPTNFIISNDIEDNIAAARRQCLRMLGVSGYRANTVASLVWEAHRG